MKEKQNVIFNNEYCSNKMNDLNNKLLENIDDIHRFENKISEDSLLEDELTKRIKDEKENLSETNKKIGEAEQALDENDNKIQIILNDVKAIQNVIVESIESFVFDDENNKDEETNSFDNFKESELFNLIEINDLKKEYIKLNEERKHLCNYLKLTEEEKDRIENTISNLRKKLKEVLYSKKTSIKNINIAKRNSKKIMAVQAVLGKDLINIPEGSYVDDNNYKVKQKSYIVSRKNK